MPDTEEAQGQETSTVELKVTTEQEGVSVGVGDENVILVGLFMFRKRQSRPNTVM